jgi:2'-5' RNA ligase
VPAQCSTDPAPVPDVDASRAPLVITLRLDEMAAAHFSALRRAHFPPHRNWLDAHVTLFHALPGSAIDTVLADVADVASRQAPFSMRVDHVRFLGAGVAYALASPEADRVRADLAARWAGLLGRQDRARRSALHITVQNKVAPDTARALYERLVARFEPEEVRAIGLEVWHYEGGPWRPAASRPFVGMPS